MFLDMGIGIGSLLWGLAIDFLGIRWLYLLCAVCVAICYGLNCTPKFAAIYAPRDTSR